MTESMAFVQLAYGRVDPQIIVDFGATRWIGSGVLSERGAYDLRLMM